MRRIGIFGGSFNPVHCGHLMVAAYIAAWTGLDEVWLTLSPQNPLKADLTLAPEADRLAMLRLAVRGSRSLRVSDVELTLPRPSFTINTLRHLRELHPDCRFSLIIGSDNWLVFPRWRSSQEIIDEFGLIVYPRPGYPIEVSALPKGVTAVDAPICSLSSTFLRQSIASGHSIEQMTPSGVIDYINEHNLYKTRINDETQQ